jgi:hypothetical protein
MFYCTTALLYVEIPQASEGSGNREKLEIQTKQDGHDNNNRIKTKENKHM